MVCEQSWKWTIRRFPKRKVGFPHLPISQLPGLEGGYPSGVLQREIQGTLTQFRMEFLGRAVEDSSSLAERQCFRLIGLISVCLDSISRRLQGAEHGHINAVSVHPGLVALHIKKSIAETDGTTNRDLHALQSSAVVFQSASVFQIILRGHFPERSSQQKSDCFGFCAGHVCTILWMNNIHFAPPKKPLDTMVGWYLQGNHHSRFLRWCRTLSIHSRGPLRISKGRRKEAGH